MHARTRYAEIRGVAHYRVLRYFFGVQPVVLALSLSLSLSSPEPDWLVPLLSSQAARRPHMRSVDVVVLNATAFVATVAVAVAFAVGAAVSAGLALCDLSLLNLVLDVCWMQGRWRPGSGATWPGRSSSRPGWTRPLRRYLTSRKLFCCCCYRWWCWWWLYKVALGLW